MTHAEPAHGQRLAGAPALTPASPSAGSPKGHWPALDGLRAFAVLAVIGYHVGVLPGGYLGVDVFFVLSGFLITTLLIGEWDARKGVSLRNFYARRVLRLFPALTCIVVVACMLAALLALVNQPGDRVYALATVRAIPWVLLFSGNFVLMLHPSGHPLGAFGHTWSLAVEEQFYLLWPAIFGWLLRRQLSRRRLAVLLAAVAATEMGGRIVAAGHGYGPDHIYYGTGTHSDGLLIGCALACWLASRPAGGLRRPAAGLVKAGSWAGAIVLPVLFVIGNRANSPVQMGMAAIATTLLLAGFALQSAPAPLARLLSSPRAVLIGRRSYGLYLWHYVTLAAAEALIGPVTGQFPASGGYRMLYALVIGLAIAAAFIAADLSYRLVELPALRLKRRFSGAEDTSASLTGDCPAQGRSP